MPDNRSRRIALSENRVLELFEREMTIGFGRSSLHGGKMDETEDSGLVNALSKAKRACIRVRWVLICVTALFACGWGASLIVLVIDCIENDPLSFVPLTYLLCYGSLVLAVFMVMLQVFLGRDQGRKTVLVTSSRSAGLYLSCSTCLCDRRVTFYGRPVI